MNCQIVYVFIRMGIEHTATELKPTEEENEKFVLTFPPEMKEEEREIIDGFNRCYNSSSIFRLLETIPREEVTPVVAVHALRLIQLLR